MQILRELDAKRHAGPFWTGTKEDWARIDSMSGKNAVYNPFECATGSGKRGVKRQFKMADLTKIKFGAFDPPLLEEVFLLTATTRTTLLPQRAAQNDRAQRRRCRWR